jgi:hypothetical protein
MPDLGEAKPRRRSSSLEEEMKKWMDAHAVQPPTPSRGWRARRGESSKLSLGNENQKEKKKEMEADGFSAEAIGIIFLLRGARG